MSADKSADAGADMSGDGRWLTYDELGRNRGIDRLSAAKLAARHRWRRQKDNRGAVQVLVPTDWLTPQRGSADVSGARSADASGDPSADVSLLVEALKAVQAQVIAAKDVQIAMLTERLERAEQGREAERARADALRDRLDEMQARIALVDAFETERSELQTEIDVLRRAVAAKEAEHTSTSAKLAEVQAEAERHAAIQSKLHTVEAELQHAQHEAQAAQDAAEALRQTEAARKARGRVRRAWRAWRGE